MFEVLSKDALLTQPNWQPLDVQMADDSSINPSVTRFSCNVKSLLIILIITYCIYPADSVTILLS